MHFIPQQDRYQMTFMSSLNDLVPPDHPVRIIDVIVDSILSASPEKFEYKGQRQIGRRAYGPGTLLKLYLYGYFNGISSSRKLEVETYRNIEVIWLLGHLRPDHKTISDYRKDYSDHIAFVTREFRRFLKDKGYIKGQRVTIDGTKVKANANRDMLTMEKIQKRLKKIESSLEGYLKQLEGNDAYDDIVDEHDLGSLEDEGTEKVLLDKIVQLQRELETLKDQKKILQESERSSLSPADPDARLMKSREGMIPAYNVQVVVDGENKMIAASEVRTEANDLGLIKEMVDTVTEETGRPPSEVLADRGYCNVDQIEEVEKNGDTTCYIPEQETSRTKEKLRFRYDGEKGEYVCSMGKRLVLIQRNKLKHNSLADVYRGIECEGCPIRSACTRSRRGRIIHRYHNQVWRDAYRERMKSNMSRGKASLRKGMVEHPFGTMKYWMGMIPLLLRGREKVQTEMNIYATVYNLKRLMNIEPVENLRELIGNYEWGIA